MNNESDYNAIECLRHLVGCDGKSQPNEDFLELAAEKDGVQIIINSITKNNYDPNYIEMCKPILESLGKNE